MKTPTNNYSNLSKSFGISKRIFYLKPDPDQHFDQLREPLIQWVYHFSDHHIVTPSLRELIGIYYNEN